MTDVVGGLRSRLIHDSLTALLEDGLEGLGWFDSGRTHEPIAFLHGPQHWEIPVEFNAIVLISQSVENDWIELGSNLSRDAVTITADLYAQNESFGLEVISDIRDLLRGRLSRGAVRGSFPIVDFRQATPSPIGYALVDDVTVQRSISQVPEEWSRHVFSLSVTLHDIYY